MLKKDAIAHFGTESALAKALGIKPQSIQDWGDEVPVRRQLQLQQITAGALVINPTLFEIQLPDHHEAA